MKTMLVLAGPNGSGKSTITKGLHNIFPDSFDKYINADEIKKMLNCSDLEAAENAQAAREWCINHGENFAFETVLSTERNLILIANAKKLGYYVRCAYMLTRHPDINVERVKKRVSLNGHDVPEEKIRTRYNRAMTLFPKLLPLCDELYVFDNSDDNRNASMILCKMNNKLNMFANEIWSKEMIAHLCNGSYIDSYITAKL